MQKSKINDLRADRDHFLLINIFFFAKKPQSGFWGIKPFRINNLKFCLTYDRDHTLKAACGAVADILCRCFWAFFGIFWGAFFWVFFQTRFWEFVHFSDKVRFLRLKNGCFLVDRVKKVLLFNARNS